MEHAIDAILEENNTELVALSDKFKQLRIYIPKQGDNIPNDQTRIFQSLFYKNAVDTLVRILNEKESRLVDLDSSLVIEMSGLMTNLLTSNP